MVVYFIICSAIRDGPDEAWNAKVAATYVLRLLRLNKFDVVSFLLQSIKLYNLSRLRMLRKTLQNI